MSKVLGKRKLQPKTKVFFLYKYAPGWRFFSFLSSFITRRKFAIKFLTQKKTIFFECTKSTEWQNEQKKSACSIKHCNTHTHSVVVHVFCMEVMQLILFQFIFSFVYLLFDSTFGTEILLIFFSIKCDIASAIECGNTNVKKTNQAFHRLLLSLCWWCAMVNAELNRMCHFENQHS